MFRTATAKGAQEDNASVFLNHRHVPVFDAREEFLHLVELMIVRGEERSRMRFRILMDVFNNGPGNGDAVVGGSAATQFIEEHEAARREVVHDV